MCKDMHKMSDLANFLHWDVVNYSVAVLVSHTSVGEIVAEIIGSKHDMRKSFYLF